MKNLIIKMWRIYSKGFYRMYNNMLTSNTSLCM